MYYKSAKKIVCFLMAAAMMVGAVSDTGMVSAAKKASLKTKSLNVNVGESKKITIKKKVSKRTYTFTSSKKKVAKVNKKGKVTGVKSGKANITVKEVYKKKGKKITRKLGVCKVVVKSVEQNNNPVMTPTPVPPVVTPTPTPTPPVVVPPTDVPVEVKPTVVPAYEKKVLDIGQSGGEYTGEAYFELGESMIYGGICEVTVKVKQNTGTDKKFTVGYEGEYLYFEVNGAYINQGTKRQETCSGSEEFTAGSGVSTEQTIKFSAVPKYSNDFNIRITCEGNSPFVIESMTVNTNPCESANYAEMVGNSLLANGNNARIKKAIEKAKAGEDVTIAYLGGSITEGFAASETKNSDCYAETSYRQFKQTFGKDGGDNVHFINAGMSGTSSALGIIRYQRDVLDHVEYGEVPDILFIDFAVNDGNDAETYEAIIRTALSQGTAVVLMFVLYTGGCNHEKDYSQIGEIYDLYMVSPGQGQRTACTDKKAFDDWFYWLENGGYGHPDVGGHRYMADCIMNMFHIIDAESVETDNISDVMEVTPSNSRSDYFVGMKTLESNTDITKTDAVSELNPGGFGGTDKGQPKLQYIKDGVEGMVWFPNEWAHTASSGSESFTMKINCSSLFIAYKQAGSGFGKAEVYVDGKLTKTLSNVSGGWNNAVIDKVIVSGSASEHDIEIKMASGDESKPFTIYAIGYSK